MFGLPSLWKRAVTALLLVICTGCVSGVRLPAIDPSGQQVFLPQPAYTTLASPTACLPSSGCRLGGWPRPAFTQPPPVPACPPVQAVPTTVPVRPAPPVAAAQLPQDRLVLTPARMVAPVNSEVILLAGICGPHGYYVTRQPIEWSLSQESVGQFIDVGEGRHSRGFPGSRRGPQKLSNDFVVSRTSTAARQITRGTPATNDDVWLQKGQAWISVTSASQGVSHITAVAAGAENWEQRRQLARIHWVDAEWVLPPPAVAKAGTSHVLTTRVVRSSSGEPLSGWKVRYVMAQAANATLGPAGASSVDVPTDANGFANVTLTQGIATPGSSEIDIRILSPSEGERPVEIGQGRTTVTWSASGLEVRITGPSVGTRDATLTYRIVATNPGDLPATNASVTARIPASLRFLNSEPTIEAFGDRLTWQLGNLAAGETRTILVNCRAIVDGSFRFSVSAHADGIVPDRVATTSTEILGQDLQVDFVDPPPSGVVGTPLSFKVAVTNLGTRPLTDVEVRDTFDAGFEHATAKASPIRQSLGTIEAGDTRRFAVTLVPRRAGTLCHTLETFSAEGHTGKARACIEVSPAELGVRVTKTGPTQANVGDEVTFTIEVTNTGDAPLTDLRIVDNYPTALSPQLASDGHEHTESGLEWRVPKLDPQSSIQREVVYRCLAVATAENGVTVTTREGRRDVTSATLVISAPPAGPRVLRRPATETEADPGSAAESAADDREGLRVEISQSTNSVSVGDVITYTVDIQNESNSSEKSVVLSFVLSEGLEFSRFNSVSAELALRAPREGRYEVERIAEIRPQGLRRFRIEARAETAGKESLHVQVVSLSGPEPRDHTLSTQVVP